MWSPVVPLLQSRRHLRGSVNLRPTRDTNYGRPSPSSRARLTLHELGNDLRSSVNRPWTGSTLRLSISTPWHLIYWRWHVWRGHRGAWSVSGGISLRYWTRCWSHLVQRSGSEVF